MEEVEVAVQEAHAKEQSHSAEQGTNDPLVTPGGLCVPKPFPDVRPRGRQLVGIGHWLPMEQRLAESPPGERAKMNGPVLVSRCRIHGKSKAPRRTRTTAACGPLGAR
jgi:hypothetical protein